VITITFAVRLAILNKPTRQKQLLNKTANTREIHKAFTFYDEPIVIGYLIPLVRPVKRSFIKLQFFMELTMRILKFGLLSCSFATTKDIEVSFISST